MPRGKMISDEVRQQIVARLEAFNRLQARPARDAQREALAMLMRRLGMPAPDSADSPLAGAYVPSFKGAYLYLDRTDWDGSLSHICRLKWTGDIENWEFAIYRYSRDSYDPEEMFFPGAEAVDGTIEGAMRAGLEAYPQ